MQLILGIDPGSRVTGYGVIRSEWGKVMHVASGCIRINGPLLTRLHQLYHGMLSIVQSHQPDMVVVERMFAAKNIDSVLKLSQARGVIISAVSNVCSQLFEYTPRSVKQVVTGSGQADKKQVQCMVTRLCHLSSAPPADAADALAIALCHAYHQSICLKGDS